MEAASVEDTLVNRGLIFHEFSEISSSPQRRSITLSAENTACRIYWGSRRTRASLKSAAKEAALAKRKVIPQNQRHRCLATYCRACASPLSLGALSTPTYSSVLDYSINYRRRIKRFIFCIARSKGIGTLVCLPLAIHRITHENVITTNQPPVVVITRQNGSAFVTMPQKLKFRFTALSGGPGVRRPVPLILFFRHFVC